MGWLPLRFRSNKVVVVGRSKRGCDMCKSGYDRPVGRRRLAHHPGGNSISQAVAIISLEGESRFIGIRQESAFHEYGRNVCPSQDKVGASADAAIICRGSAYDLTMNVRCQRRALIGVIIGLDPVCAGSGSGVEMDADEDAIPIMIRDTSARS